MSDLRWFRESRVRMARHLPTCVGKCKKAVRAYRQASCRMASPATIAPCQAGTGGTCQRAGLGARSRSSPSARPKEKLERRPSSGSNGSSRTPSPPGSAPGPGPPSPCRRRARRGTGRRRPVSRCRRIRQNRHRGRAALSAWKTASIYPHRWGRSRRRCHRGAARSRGSRSKACRPWLSSGRSPRSLCCPDAGRSG